MYHQEITGFVYLFSFDGLELLLFSFLTFGIFEDNDLWLRDIGTSVGGPGSPLPCTVR